VSQGHASPEGLRYNQDQHDWVVVPRGSPRRFRMPEEAAANPNRKEVVIYTDGAAAPNPGAGGYGVVLRFGIRSKEVSGGFRLTTNNRMELMAVIVGLEALKEPCKVTLHSDSQYIVNAVTSGAAFRWRANGWAINRGRTKPAKNTDLWERLLAAYERHEVEMVWVKGHAGIEDNERCDALAMAACQRDDLPPDPGFHGSEPATTKAGAVVHEATPKTKMLAEGQPCRKCSTPVVKRTPRKKTLKPNQTYYFAWYLFCPGCKSMYMVEEAKQEVTQDEGRLLG
jgi:ribonuclease HI